MSLKILPAARARLLEIWSYTESTWGGEQADRYVSGLIEAIRRHGNRRDRWKPVRHRKLLGVYFIKHAHHFIPKAWTCLQGCGITPTEMPFSRFR